MCIETCMDIELFTNGHVFFFAMFYYLQMYVLLLAIICTHILVCIMCYKHLDHN